MRIAAAVVALFAAPAAARAEGPVTYAGASLELSNGLQGASEVGFAFQYAPSRQLEVEAGAIRHKVDGTEGLDAHDTWLLTSAARAKLPIPSGTLFAGIGLVTGEHGVVNGCASSGFIDFCGDKNGTLVYRHWQHAVWLRPEIGGEASFGPVSLRTAIAPVIQLAPPDVEEGCLACDDGDPGVMVTVGLHGRIPL